MKILSTLTLLCATLVAAPPCLGASRDEDRSRRMPESVKRVETETGGRVLQVRPMQRGDREIYRMKVLTPEGRVRVMQDDPRRRPREPAPPAPPRNRDDR